MRASQGFHRLLLTIMVLLSPPCLAIEPKSTEADSLLSLSELESLLASSTADAQEKLVARISTQDTKNLATLMILLNRKTEQLSLQDMQKSMLQQKERLEQERLLQDTMHKMNKQEARYTKALIKKEAEIAELKKKIKSCAPVQESPPPETPKSPLPEPTE